MPDRWVENILVESLGLRPGERVLVVSDRTLREAGAALVAGARSRGAALANQMFLPELGRAFTVVPTALVQAVREADVLVMIRADLELWDEDPVVRAMMSAFREAGRGRWASLAQVDELLLNGELSADFGVIPGEVERLAALLRSGSRVRITSAAGTDLTLSYGGRPLQLETGLIRSPGAIGNLPAGEVYVAPLETSADGRLVVDLSLGDIWLDLPVTLTFERGRVVDAEGGWALRDLRQRLGEDDWAWTIGEFGLGANPHIKRGRGRVAHDEKSLGTAHIALGANLVFGGKNPAATHYDCVIADAHIEVLD